MSAAANPAAPPPTMTIEVWALVDGATTDPMDRFGGFSFSLTNILSSTRSTRQAAMGSSAGAQAEAGVMHGAPYGIIDDEAVGERGVVMRARGADCKVVLSAAHQERLFATHASPDDCTVRELLYGDAAGKIQVIGLLHAGTPVIGIGAT